MPRRRRSRLLRLPFVVCLRLRIRSNCCVEETISRPCCPGNRGAQDEGPEPVCQFGRTVAVAVNVGWANGVTRAFIKAARMQPSAGLPAALPETPTLWALPSDPKVMVAWEMASSGPRHARAAGKAAPNAPWIAPCEGLRGTLPGAGMGASGLGAAVAVPVAVGLTPAACCIKDSRLALVDGAGAAVAVGTAATTTGLAVGVDVTA